jgi:hypothetical protein
VQSFLKATDHFQHTAPEFRQFNAQGREHRYSTAGQTDFGGKSVDSEAVHNERQLSSVKISPKIQ